MTRHKGRGACDNPPNRFHDQSTEPFDDGWDHDPASRLRTQVGSDASRNAITYNESPDIPFDRSVNPYRGCEHGCIYCYARPSHAWLDLSPGLDFESRLFVRHDLARQLYEEFSHASYHAAPLALGTVTDAYQPIEREFRITRQVLEVLAETRHPVVVVTKSALIERDIDLLTELARQQLVEVAVSLTTLQPALARTMEPRAAAPARRLRLIRTLSQAGIPVRAMLAPIIPVLNEAEIESLLQAAAAAGARAADYVLLRLPLEVAPLFRNWLEQNFPDSASHVMNHVQQLRGGRDNDPRFGHRLRGTGVYADLIGQRFRLATGKAGLTSRVTLRSDLFRRPEKTGQLALF